MAPAVEYKMMKLVPPPLPFDRPRSFDEASLLTPTSQDGTFKVNLRADWAFGPNVNGGYLIGVLLRAAKERCAHHNNTNPSRSHPDPTSWTTRFLDSTGVGEAEIRTQVLRSSSTTTCLRVDLWQNNKMCMEAIVIQGDIQAAQTHPLTLPSSSTRMPDLPFQRLKEKFGKVTEKNLIEDGWQTRDQSEFHQFLATKPYIRYYQPPGSDLWNSRHIVHPTLGPSFRDMWVSFGTENPLHQQNIPVAIDNFASPHLNFPQGAEYFITTENISCEMRKTCSADGWEWLFGRAELKECSGGKIVTDVTLFDTDGQIVALARLVNVMISLKTLMGQKPKKRKPQSKM